MIGNIVKWGRRCRPALDVEGALRRLHVDEGKSPAVIGEKFGGEGRAVRFWIDALGIETDAFEPRIIARARRAKSKRRKFRTLADYFRARGTVGLSSMVRELGVSRTTVEAYYRAFVEGLRDMEA